MHTFKSDSKHYLRPPHESPLRTPTTLTSLSFSSQDLISSQPSSRRHTPCPAEKVAREARNFQGEYLEFGLWPDMPLHNQAELKAKYRAQKTRSAITTYENQRLKMEIQRVCLAPCKNCELERARHNVTKKALEEAMALSSVLLGQVMEMDGKPGKGKTTRRGSNASPETQRRV